MMKNNPTNHLLLLAVVCFLAGCGKKNPSPEVSVAGMPETNRSASPVYIRPATTTIIPSTGAQPDLNQMTHSLRGWVAQTHRVPKDFEDFVSQANIQFSPPPAGKKFAIGRRMTVVLVNQ